MKKPAFVVMAAVLVLAACSRSNNPPGQPSSGSDSVYWTKINTGYNITLSDIWFTDSLHGYMAAGADVNLYSSNDGGLTWKKISGVKGSMPFLSVYFLDNLHGYAIGSSDLAITTDGGNTWKVKPLPAGFYRTKSWVNIQFISPATGFITTGVGAYKTTDTGTSWRTIIPSVTNTIFFLDDKNGWAQTAPDSICMTSDGGEHWKRFAELPIPSNYGPNYGPDLYDVLQFTDDQHGWFMNFAMLRSTSDGGVHWKMTVDYTTPRSNGPSLTDFQMLTSQEGYLATHEQVLKTHDGGASWQPVYTPPETSITSIYFLNEHYGWACCANGIVLRYHH